MPARNTNYSSTRPKPFIRQVLEEYETQLGGMTSGQPGYAAMVSHVSSLRDRADRAENDPSYGAPPPVEAPAAPGPQPPAQASPVQAPAGPGIQFAPAPGATGLQSWTAPPAFAPGTALATGPQGAKQVEQLPVMAPRQAPRSPPNPFPPIKGTDGQDVYGDIQRLFEAAGIIQAPAGQEAAPGAPAAQGGAPAAPVAPVVGGEPMGGPAGPVGAQGPAPFPAGEAANEAIREVFAREERAMSSEAGKDTEALAEAYIDFIDQHGPDQIARLASDYYSSHLLAMHEDITKHGTPVYDAAKARTGHELSFVLEARAEAKEKKAEYEADSKAIEGHVGRIVSDDRMDEQDRSRRLGQLVTRWTRKHGDDPERMPTKLRAAWELRNEATPYVRVRDVPKMTANQATAVKASIGTHVLGRKTSRARKPDEMGGEGTGSTVTERKGTAYGTLKDRKSFDGDEDAYLSALYYGSKKHDAPGLEERFEAARVWVADWARSQRPNATEDQIETLARREFEYSLLHAKEHIPRALAKDLLRAWKKFDGVAKKEAEEKPVQQLAEWNRELDELRALADTTITDLPASHRRDVDPDRDWTSWLDTQEQQDRALWLDREIRGEPQPDQPQPSGPPEPPGPPTAEDVNKTTWGADYTDLSDPVRSLATRYEESEGKGLDATWFTDYDAMNEEEKDHIVKWMLRMGYFMPTPGAKGK